MKIIHRVSGLLATVTIATFLTATLSAWLGGSHATIALVAHRIVAPGLFILIPALAATGGSGFWLSRSRMGRLVSVKIRRMRLIAMNGLLVLVPTAMVLDYLTHAGSFSAPFIIIQVVEWLAGAVNMTLMGLNIRDGLRMNGRLRRMRTE
ncbi:MAG: hypothetical protein ACYDEV_11335 [Acidiferrobacter sp.]